MTSLPKGFRGSGIAAGIKSSGNRDLALIVNDGPHKFGTAVFTSNRVHAAPVAWSKQVIADKEISAIILNSGGANACTGPEGFADTHKTAEVVAKRLSISAGDVIVCSTGLIGVRLPMDKVLAGIDIAVKALTTDQAEMIAESIMTTDSKPKFISINKKGASFFGMAKGAGMLAPSLATMLSVLVTDAIVNPTEADLLFKKACAQTFDRIDSDGCMSTNDTVTFMSSGASGITLTGNDLYDAIYSVLSYLAQELVGDAEGHTKIVEIITKGAASERDAISVGRSCARNNLLKCALHGEDANWGRVLAAIGTTDAQFDPLKLDVSLNGVMVCKDSAPGQSRDLCDLSNEKISIEIDLKSGSHSATIWTNDLTAMYVHENSAYSS